jgi:hypothetical protein
VTINATVEAASLPWKPLGELFVGRGLITEAELETALAEQAATGKRLGEILVERGLVSGPDLTDALMDQLGVEISKEEGFGSGLWAEIKRRHRRARPDGTFEDEEDEPRPVLTAAIAEARQAVEGEPPEESETEPAREVEFDAGPESDVEPAVAEIDEDEFERELEEIASDYSSPAPNEPQPEPATAAEPESELYPESEPQPVPVAQGEDTEDLRAELEAAREDLAHLQGMLADAMTALAALTAEARGVPYES